MKKLRAKQITRAVSLLELLVAIAILAILASISYPSYQKFKLEANRVEAQTAVTNMYNTLSNYLVTTNTKLLTQNILNNLALPTTTKNGYYTLAVYFINGTDCSASCYVIAQAAATQTADKNCAVIWIDFASGNKYSSTATIQPSTGCW